MPKVVPSGPPTPREEARRARLDVYRQHVLDAAERVFAEHGFEAAKLQDISHAAGVSMGTIYGVFPGKNELLDAILDGRGREFLALAQGVVSRAEPPLETLLRLSEAYIDYFLDHRPFLMMHLREGRAWVLSPGGDARDRAATWSTIHELQAGIFRQGIEAGVFVDEDPSFLAKTFSALDQVVLADWAANGMRLDRAELIRRLQGLVGRTFAFAAEK